MIITYPREIYVLKVKHLSKNGNWVYSKEYGGFNLDEVDERIKDLAKHGFVVYDCFKILQHLNDRCILRS